jgi:DNA-binding MarR family transcriptional regulator
MLSTKPLGHLVSILHRHHFVALTARLKQFGISTGQFPILMYLSRFEGASQERIARHFHVDKGTIARAVRRLEDDGFIYRMTDPKDRRAYGLFLTEKGASILPDIIEAEKGWEEELLQGLSPEEIDDIYAVLTSLAERSLHIAHLDHDDHH